MIINILLLAFLEHVTVLIGIAYKGEAIAGVIHQPYYNESQGRTIWGIKGVGIFGIQPTISIFYLIE